jgi:protein-disulfide isomerase
MHHLGFPMLVLVASLAACRPAADAAPPPTAATRADGAAQPAPQELTTRHGITAPAPLLDAARGVTLGDSAAPVHLVVFSDYSCPHCANFAAASRLLEDRYSAPGRVQKVYYDFPLSRMARSYHVALAGRCAQDQDRFWPFHYLALDRQPRWREEADLLAALTGYADQLGLDTGAFDACMADLRHVNTVNAGRQLGDHLGVRWVPWVLVNGRLIEDAGDFTSVVRALDEELARAGS